MSLAQQTHCTHLPLPNKLLAFALSGLLRWLCERCIVQKRRAHKQYVQPARTGAVSTTAQLRLTLVVAVPAVLQRQWTPLGKSCVNFGMSNEAML